MICIKCEKEIPEESIYCLYCGKKQVVSAPKHKPKHRGNGQGTVYKKNGKYIAVVTYTYGTKENKKKKTISKYFDKKTDAIAALPSLRYSSVTPDMNISFSDAFEKMIVLHEKKASQYTLDGYRQKLKYFDSIAFLPLKEIKTDHIQRCIDECDKGSRTKEAIKTVASLVFKYGMQNDIVEKNYASFAYTGKSDAKEYEPFTKEEIKKIYEAMDTVPYAGHILCLIFTGFRPNEMFKLKKTDFHETYFIGGSKTEAGRDRIIPIPRVILPYVQTLAEQEGEYMFPAPDGSKMDLSNFRKRYYYPALEQIGVRALPPYSCRHTYATLLKDINAPITDKQKLMGHASFEMTAHYTHTDIESLERIAEHLDVE